MERKQFDLTEVNYFIFIGYLKTGGGVGKGSSTPPESRLDPLLLSYDCPIISSLDILNTV